MSAVRYIEDSVLAGAAESLDVSLVAPWSGHLKMVMVHFEIQPVADEELVIYHQNKNGLAIWKTEVFSDNPLNSQLTDYTFVAPISLQNGDSIIVEYPNSDDQTITASITLEEN